MPRHSCGWRLILGGGEIEIINLLLNATYLLLVSQVLWNQCSEDKCASDAPSVLDC